MAEYDGSIRIGVLLDNNKAQRQLNQLKDKLVKQVKEVDEQAKAVSRLQSEYDKLVSTDPKGITKLENELKKAEAEAARVDAELQRTREMAKLDVAARGAVSPEVAAQLQELTTQLTEAEGKFDVLHRKWTEAKLPKENSEEAVKLKAQIEEATAKLDKMKASSAQTSEQINKLGARLKSVPVRFGQFVVGGVKKIAESTKNAAASTGNLTKRVRSLGREKGFAKAGKQAGNFASRLKRIVSGALVFNIISRGLTQLTKQLGSYLTANKGFADALGNVKGNLLTAFQPIYDAVLPALTSLLGVVENVTAKIASFMATIFGTTAQKAQQNAEALNQQAQATKDVNDATKKAAKTLASFDTIEILGGKDSETAADAATPAAPSFDTDYSQVQMPEWLTNFWKVFEDSWAEHGERTIESFKTAFEKIKTLVSNIGKTFAKVWSSGAGEKVLGAIQRLLQTIFGIIGDIAGAFSRAWDTHGESVIQSISNMLHRILEVINTIAASFREAWNDGSGERILSTIHSIVERISGVIGKFAEKFRAAWAENDNGKRIWEAILAVIETVLGWIDNLVEITGEWAAELDLEPLISAVREALENVAPVLQIILDVLTDIFENWVLPVLGWVIETALPGVIGLVADLLGWLKEHPRVIEALIGLVGAFVAAWALKKAIGMVSTLLSTLTPMKLVLALIVGLVIAIASAWDDMSGWQKAIAVIGGMIAVLAAAAIAIGAVQSALTMGIAIAAIVIGIGAVAAAVKSATKSVPQGGGRGGAIGNAIYGSMSGYNVPHLADGAVISPNNEFLAVLGDQKHGTNIEAPLATIEQALANVLAHDNEGGGQQVTVNFTGSLSQLARVLQPEITVETNRRGAHLVSGGI